MNMNLFVFFLFVFFLGFVLNHSFDTIVGEQIVVVFLLFNIRYITRG